MSLREETFHEIINKDCEFFDTRKTGDLISRLQSDTAKIEGALASQVSMLLKSAIFNIVVVVMFFIISWKMTFFTLGIMIPTLFLGPSYGKFMQRIQKEISDKKAESSNIAEEAFSNIRTLKAFATEDHECVQYFNKNESIYELAKRAARAYGCFSFFMQFVMFGSLDALIYFAAYLNRENELTIGDFTSFQFYMFSFLINFMTFTSVIGEVMGVFGTASGIAEIYLTEAKVNTTGGEMVKESSV
jgi:ATP-binding cassette subfamily B protein